MKLQDYIEKEYPKGSFLVPLLDEDEMVKDFSQINKEASEQKLNLFKGFIKKVNDKIVNSHESYFPEAYFNPSSSHNLIIEIENNKTAEELDCDPKDIKFLKEFLIINTVAEYPEKRQRNSGSKKEFLEISLYFSDERTIAICYPDKKYTILTGDDYNKIWDLYNEESNYRYNTEDEDIKKESEQIISILKKRGLIK